MSFSPRPCAHCGGVQFHVLPDVMLEPHKVVMFGRTTGGQRLGWWKVTIVICVQCTRTELFTPNAAELVSLTPGAHVVTSTR
ncbi:MAG: hypothetical protein KIT84_44290 [Labilithrix sp.]|nr:hypothetical protein [Labilithrix sp.]MCW5818099.1 hypothetical protein [Labilithrix sp.]